MTTTAPSESSPVRVVPSATVLTAREPEVLTLIADGLRTREIAARLFISSKTVDTHRQNLMRKTGLDGIDRLTKLAIREGLSALE